MPTTDRAVNLYEKDQAICAPWSISTLEGVTEYEVSGDKPSNTNPIHPLPLLWSFAFLAQTSIWGSRNVERRYGVDRIPTLV
jgi:hypothetical protein